MRRAAERHGTICRAGKHDKAITGVLPGGKCRECRNERQRVPGAVPYADRTHCPKGHPYSGDNLRLVTTSRGGVGRRCRTCDNERNNEQYLKRKARGYYDR